MKRVLFVDDESHVLDGLRRMLRSRRREWEMVFACGGAEALEWIEAEPFDVVVSDMRMPGMDGAELLSQVMVRHPHTVRIILSGHTELESAMRAVSAAHQCLSKPCDANDLAETVRRACELQTLLRDPQLIAVASDLEPLPALPDTYRALTLALAGSNVELSELAQIVESDTALAAKVLRLVNSSFFGLAQRMTNIEQALTYLGVMTLRNLVLATEVFRAFDKEDSSEIERLKELQAHSTLVAKLMRAVAPNEVDSSDAFAAGMLHDIGLLLLAARRPDRLREAAEAAGATGGTLESAEKQLDGVTHAEIGAFLLGAWGLPNPIVEAVANHHRPGSVVEDRAGLVTVTHVCEVLIERRVPALQLSGAPAPELALDHLERFGLVDLLPEWERLADELVAEGAGA